MLMVVGRWHFRLSETQDQKGKENKGGEKLEPTPPNQKKSPSKIPFLNLKIQQERSKNKSNEWTTLKLFRQTLHRVSTAGPSMLEMSASDSFKMQCQPHLYSFSHVPTDSLENPEYTYSVITLCWHYDKW